MSKDGKNSQEINLPYSSNTLNDIAAALKYLGDLPVPDKIPNGLDPAVRDGLAFLREKNLIDSEGDPFHRAYQPARIIFRCSGFYSTDHRPIQSQQ
jgi:hypothetical protein